MMWYLINCVTDKGLGRELNARANGPANQSPELGRLTSPVTGNTGPGQIPQFAW